MKHLKDILNYRDGDNDTKGSVTLEDYAFIENLFGLDTDLKYESHHFNSLYNSVIDENLSSHNPELLAKCIDNYFGRYIHSIITPDGNNPNNIILTFESRSDLKKVKLSVDFDKILKFFGYFVGGDKPNTVDGTKYESLLIEPEFPKIFDPNNTFNGIYYHFTELDNWKKIRKTGLRCRGDGDLEDRDYTVPLNPLKIRNFPNRIYLCGINESPNKIDFSRPEVLEFINELFDNNSNIELGVIKVDTNLYRTDVNIYEDPSMTGEYTDYVHPGFTYNNIPSRNLTLFKIISKNGNNLEVFNP